MGTGPCLCGDPECWSCGPLIGGGMSIAEGVYEKWEAMEPGTKQDLADLCEQHEGQEAQGQRVDSDLWTFSDGSSIELVWGGGATIVRDANGDAVTA